MAIQYGDLGLGVCERCRRAVPASQLSGGLCGACAVPGREPEMAMAASLDMDAIVRDVVEAGLNVEAALSWDDAWAKIKTKLGLAKQPPPTGDHLDALMRAIQTTMPVQQRVMEDAQDKSVQDVAEAGKALPRELRKRFPKR